jgi:hypothetical protein
MGDIEDKIKEIRSKEEELNTLRTALREQGLVMTASTAAPNTASIWKIWNRRGVLAMGLGFFVALLVLGIVFFFTGGSSDFKRFSIAARWVEFAGLLAASVALIIGCALVWPDRFEKSWAQLDRILSSGGFYFFAGLALLLYAIHTTSTQVHPSLTFLLAMLGMAIMLFGTGSQAVGTIATAGARQLDPLDARDQNPANGTSGDNPSKPAQAAAQATVKAVEAAAALQTDAEKAGALAGVLQLAKEASRQAADVAAILASTGPATPTQDWSPVKANAAIAGGAAVLTALFGYGVIHYRTDIKDVFGFYDHYVKLRIEACAASSPTCAAIESDGAVTISDFALAEYSVDAQTINGSSLYTIQSGNELQVIIFSDTLDQNVPIRLRLSRRKENLLIGPEVDRDIDLTISPKTFEPTLASDTPATPATGTPAPATPALQPSEICTQWKRGIRVNCGLSRVTTGNRGDQLNTVLYSLNFYRKDNTITEAKVNHVDVKFD